MLPAHSAVPAVLSEILRKAPLTPEKVAFAWRTAVGPVVDRASRVRLLDDGTLEVACDDPQWAREITRSRRLILARLAPLLGDGTVARLRTRGPERPSPAGRL
ncbi:MAG: DUF721 domain-containing protein [Acidobacteriota bacterium]